MRALRDSEIASVSIGLNPIMIRNAAFGISAATAGVAVRNLGGNSGRRWWRLRVGHKLH
jgi:hypothetical protein